MINRAANRHVATINRMGYKKQKQYRLPGYDYSQAGEYFITICTKDRIHYFGQVQDGMMHLSDIGTIAKDNLLMIPEQFKNTVLDEWVVMHSMPGQIMCI